VKLPRDLSGKDLATLLRRYGYQVIRQTGSHLRLTSTLKGREHHLTIPSHKALRLGTLSAILGEVSQYLKITRERLADQMFGE
jgi:predicted RNA binding protein YcfA (HicA-like mRNA interferase family)